MQRMRKSTKLGLFASINLAIAFAGCGGGSQAPSSASTAPASPAAANATVTGQYNLLLTSTNGRGTTSIYTDFTQTGTTFTGAVTTLVCPSNDLSQCEGNNAPTSSIIPSGAVSGANVTIVISFPNTAGTDRVTMVGAATGTNLAGTYTDNLGDAGTWTGSAANSLSGNYRGTFNSTSNPLAITPTILITLAQDANVNLSGTATIMTSPCISSLTLSGQAIGGAFSLTDAASKAVIVAVPTGNSFNFSYNFDPTAAHCAGDFGRGVMTNQGSFDY